MRLLKNIGDTLLLLPDIAAFFARRNKNTAQRKNVLVVKLDRIGDFVLWLDAAKELRALYPADRYSITLLGNALWTELAGPMRQFDRIWGLHRNKFKKNIFYRLRLLSQVRQAGFDVVIHPVFSREIAFGDAIVRLSGAGVKVGSQGDFANSTPWQKKISDGWYTRLIPALSESSMELQRNIDFMRRLGAVHACAGIPQLPVMSATGDLPPKPYAVLFPSASVPMKKWPAEYYREVGKRIHEELSWSVVLCGGREDYATAKKMEQEFPFPIDNRVGRTSLQQLVSLIAGARLLVGNDSSAVHIAAAVSVPSVCIAGGGHLGRFLPYAVECGRQDAAPVVVTRKKDCFGCNWKCRYLLSRDDPAPCVKEVGVDDVWKAIRFIHDRSGKE